MSVRRKGNTNVRLVSTERVFDEQTGFQTLLTYEGFKEGVDSSMGLFSTVPGLRMNTKQVNGPWYRLTVAVSGTDDGSTEGPVDKWSRVTEFAQEDIRNNPKVVDLAGTEDTLALWVKEIKEALKADPPGLTGTVDPGQAKIYRLYARGADAHEVRRIVIRRRRIIPIEFAAPTAVAPIEPIYTRAQLISTFGIPVNAQVLIPVDPDFDPPSDTAWSWKERANESDFVPSINKTEEVMEWTFAAWSTVLYDLVS